MISERMKNKGFTLVELLAVIAILAILIIIALPNILKMFNEAQMKLFLQEARNINKAAEDSYLSQKMGTTTPTETIYTYVDGEESSTGNIKVSIIGKKPENGELIIRANGETALAFHNGKYCARKMFGSDEITLSNVTVDQCVLDNVPSGFTSELCFDFNSSTGTIERYFDYQNDNSSNPICPTDVVIPNKINGVNVIALADFSFAYCNYVTYNDTNQEDLVLLSSTVSENNLIYKLNKTFLYNEDNNVSNIDSPLRCVSLTSVIIPNGVETIGDVAFRGNDISSVVIPNSVTSIGWDAFAGNNLTSIVIPNNVTNISEGAFSYNALTSVTIPSSITTFDGNPFGNNPNLTNIIVDSNNPEYMSSNNALYTKDGKTLISGTKTSSNSILSTTTTIGNSAFYGMGLTNVTIPTSVTSIGSYAFYGNQLTSVTIPNSVTSIGGLAFSQNRIAQGNFRIDNTSGSVSIESNILVANGANGTTIITPTYLR